MTILLDIFERKRERKRKKEETGGNCLRIV